MKNTENGLKYCCPIPGFGTGVIFILSLFLYFSSTAQSISFVASVENTEIAIDEIFEVQFTLNNATGTGLTPPSFLDFQVFDGPSVYTSTTIINGKVSMTNSYTYTLRPRRLGSITIGKAVIKANNRFWETMPITIKVVQRSANTSPNINSGKESDCFIRAEPLISEAYPGQQVALDYKVFRTVNIESATILNEPDYKGFYKADLPDRERSPKEVNIGGKRWLAQTMKRVALFPQETGNLSIDPIQIQLNIVAGSSDPFGFFGKTKPVNRNSNTATLLVKPLPDGAPASFSGAVGQYKVASALPSSNATTGDIISLHLTVEGNGDPKRIQAPDLVLPEGIEVYDIRAAEEQPAGSQDQLVFTKTFEYLLKSKKPGDYKLQPAFSWYDPSEKRYRTWNDKSFELTVKKGNGTATAPPPVAGKTADDTTSFWRWDNIAIPALLGLVLTAIFIYYRFLQKKKISELDPTVTPAVYREQQPRKHQRLTLAYQELKAGNTKAFYDALSRDLYDFAAAQYHLPLSDYSIEKVRERMSSAGVSADLAGEFVLLLQSCELALYAGSAAGGLAGMEAAYLKAGEILGKFTK